MLWRPAYAPRVLELDELPPVHAMSLTGEPFAADSFVGSFGLMPHEVGIWQRLIGNPAVIYFVDPSELPNVEAITPRSRWATTYVAEIRDTWEQLIQPDRPERAFAVVRDLVVVGAPTEDVWERFEGILNT